MLSGSPTFLICTSDFQQTLTEIPVNIPFGFAREDGMPRVDMFHIIVLVIRASSSNT